MLASLPGTIDRVKGAVRDLCEGDVRFNASSERGLHGLRVIGRLLPLSGTPATRNDSEGAEDVDVKASSHTFWKKFVFQLDLRDRRLLEQWRAGAASTPTRRVGFARIDPAWSVACPWCDCEFASAGHFFVEFPRFHDLRRRCLICLSCLSGLLASLGSR